MSKKIIATCEDDGFDPFEITPDEAVKLIKKRQRQAWVNGRQYLRLQAAEWDEYIRSTNPMR